MPKPRVKIGSSVEKRSAEPRKTHISTRTVPFDVCVDNLRLHFVHVLGVATSSAEARKRPGLRNFATKFSINICPRPKILLWNRQYPDPLLASMRSLHSMPHRTAALLLSRTAFPLTSPNLNVLLYLDLFPVPSHSVQCPSSRI